jgi:hypothetical protein
MFHQHQGPRGFVVVRLERNRGSGSRAPDDDGGQPGLFVYLPKRFRNQGGAERHVSNLLLWNFEAQDMSKHQIIVVVLRLRKSK